MHTTCLTLKLYKGPFENWSHGSCAPKMHCYLPRIYCALIILIYLWTGHSRTERIMPTSPKNMSKIQRLKNHFICKIPTILGPCDDAKRTGPWFNIKMTSYQYRKFHCGDKTILRQSYLHNGISYTDKMTSSYWIRALAAVIYSPAETWLLDAYLIRQLCDLAFTDMPRWTSVWFQNNHISMAFCKTAVTPRGYNGFSAVLC